MNRLTPFCLLFCLFCFCTKQQAQTFTDSNLPIIVINVDQGSIPDEPKVLATMKIIYAGEGKRNLVSYQFDNSKLDYNGRIGIETRGSSSQSLEKKQYGLTTLKADNVSNNSVSLLGMSAENDWILSGLAFDASFMRDYLAFTLSRKIGQYAPNTKFCELVINGEYRGIYMLVEKIKVDDNRVNLAKLKPTDNAPPEVTGGYITKADKIAGVDASAWKIDGTDFVHEFPKADNVTPYQNNYIQSVFLDLESKSSNSHYTAGYPSVIDIPSFIDFMIINELGSNVDAYQFSTYFHKDKNAKLRAGPIWDSNLTFGYDLVHWGYDRCKTDVWQFSNVDNNGPNFWRNLFNDATFKCYFAKRWHELTQPGQPLSETSLYALVDETAALLAEASTRDHQKWDDAIWTPLYRNIPPPLGPLDPSLSAQVNLIKSFITQRIDWMTANLGSFSACNNVSKPPLVITRIDYRPATNGNFPESDEQEFIEIKNTGNQVVDLTGFYFSGTGFVYQFREGFTLAAQGVIQLVNNSNVFFRKHGFVPYDEFTRDLSNTSQRLTLADAYGNIVDEVPYSIDAPWPDANGNGYYLKLNNVAADNSIGSNWVASNEAISSTVVITGVEEAGESMVHVYPNPTSGVFKVTSEKAIKNIVLYNLQGMALERFEPNATQQSIDMTKSIKGVYSLLITIDGKQYLKKIIKE